MKGLLSNLIRRQNKLLFFIFYFLFSISAEARIYIQIDQPSGKKFPIAVVDLIAEGRSSSGEWSRKIPEIIRKNLLMTGLFDLVPEGQFPKEQGALSPNPATIQFAPWSLIGAQAFVIGSYNTIPDGVQVELHLYDPLLGQHLVGKTYATNPKEMSVVAHHFADAIVQELTGEPGVFSTKISYVQEMRRKKEIGVMEMDGLNRRIITSDKTINLSPAWSPDGSTLAYTTFTKGGSAEIAVVGSGGGVPKRITSTGSINLSPAWSPKGVLTVASALSGDTDLYLLGMSGDVIRRLTTSLGIDVNPSWSPDGSAFVFASTRAGKLHLFRADASGENIQRLTFVGTQNDNPVWSPKGDKIAFQGLSGGWDIFVMNADGSMIQRLTSNGVSESPSWAPNGRFITFSLGGRVAVMREDGSNLTMVGPPGSLQPSWGPWGK